jgi:hypothetical protein
LLLSETEEEADEEDAMVERFAVAVVAIDF